MNEERIHFFDNLRLLLVIFVVLMHGSVANGIYSSWWFVHDLNRHFFFDIFITVLDVWLMPSLFFIAGYFTLPSINQGSAFDFVQKKLRRIALPWFVGMLFYVPTLSFLSGLNAALTKNIKPEWYGDTWLNHIKNISSIKLGPFVNSQEHFWFLSLLFYFFMIFLLLYRGWEKFIKKRDTLSSQKRSSSRSMLEILLLAGLLCSVGEFVSYSCVKESSFLSISLFLDVQIVKILPYSVMFSLGIFAYSGKWFLAGKTPGHPAVWFVMVVVFGGLFYFSNTAFYSGGEADIHIKAARAFSRSFLSISILMFSIPWYKKNLES